MSVRARFAALVAVAPLFVGVATPPASAVSTTGVLTIFVNAGGFYGGVYQSFVSPSGPVTMTGVPKSPATICPAVWRAHGEISGAFTARYRLKTVGAVVKIELHGPRGKGVGVFAPATQTCPPTGAVVANITLS